MTNRKEAYICIEIGGTNLRIGLFTPEGETIDFEVLKTENLSKAKDKIEYLYQLISSEYSKIDGIELKAIGFSVASLIDREKGFIYSSPMIEGFNNIPLKEELEKKMNVPVIIEKDVNTVFAYDLTNLSLNDLELVVGVYLGTGIGNAIAIDGKVYNGFNGVAAELGHIPVLGSKDVCGCGKVGCVETKGCGRVLEDIAVNTFSCSISELFVKHSQSVEVKAALTAMAIAIATEITILDPKIVVLGGGLIDMKSFPINEFIDIIKANLRQPKPAMSVKFIRSTNNKQSGVLGLVKLMNQQIK